MQKVDLKNSIRIVFSLIVTFLCIGFVCWQSIQCFHKYFKYPQGTKLSIDYTANHQFPAITICADPDKNQNSDKWYNETKLSECGINM